MSTELIFLPQVHNLHKKMNISFHAKFYRKDNWKTLPIAPSRALSDIATYYTYTETDTYQAKNKYIHIWSILWQIGRFFIKKKVDTALLKVSRRVCLHRSRREFVRRLFDSFFKTSLSSFSISPIAGGNFGFDLSWDHPSPWAPPTAYFFWNRGYSKKIK